MKIGIDISNTIGDKTGIGYYSSHLVQALAEIDTKNTYILYPFFYFIKYSHYKTAVRPIQKNFSIKYEKIPRIIVDRLWQSPIPKKWVLGKVDVLHSTTYCSPIDHYGKLIVTVYDLSFLTYPHFHTEVNRTHCMQETKKATESAEHIIAISEHGKSELLHFFDIDPDRITVTPLAAHERFKPDKRSTYILKKYQIPEHYILSIGTLEPRKNLKTLIIAYLKLSPSLRKRHKLIITGKKGWLQSDIEDLINNNPSDIRFLGYVPEEELPSLYSGAMFFVYPSYYEGFGLPIVEAMACGTPVITSNVSSMPEIAGESAIFFNPCSQQELYNAMMLLLQDEGLRIKLSRKGLLQSRKFSWKDTAGKTIKVYEKAYNK
jgi:glycosyltransferase involved in cell wall biosynthesis